MSVHENTSYAKQSVLKSGPTPEARDRVTRVPEWAENMEHTLRRLIRKRQEKHDKDPGLYR